MAKIIGITGGIGSGKSIVGDFFKVLGVPIYNADDRAKYLIENDLSLKKSIVNLLGDEAYDANGYNRKWVAATVFSKPDLLQQLNGLVHPRVAEDTQTWFLQHQNLPYVLREAAIISAESKAKLDGLIVVLAPLKLRVSRIQKRDPQRSLAEIENIISRQKTEDEYTQLADYHIFNDDNQLIIPQVLRIHEVLKS